MEEAMDRTLRVIRRTATLRSFFAHLAIFAISLGAAFVLNLDWRYFWPLLGWTVGVALHGLSAIGPGQFIGAHWEAERLRQLLHDSETSGA